MTDKIPTPELTAGHFRIFPEARPDLTVDVFAESVGEALGMASDRWPDGDPWGATVMVCMSHSEVLDLRAAVANATAADLCVGCGTSSLVDEDGLCVNCGEDVIVGYPGEIEKVERMRDELRATVARVEHERDDLRAALDAERAARAEASAFLTVAGVPLTIERGGPGPDSGDEVEATLVDRVRLLIDERNDERFEAAAVWHERDRLNAALADIAAAIADAGYPAEQHHDVPAMVRGFIRSTRGGSDV